jgi:hypothetical protein
LDCVRALNDLNVAFREVFGWQAATESVPPVPLRERLIQELDGIVSHPGLDYRESATMKRRLERRTSNE